MRILVTGAAGRLGRVAVGRIAAAGHEVRAMSRSARTGDGAEWVVGDLVTGASVADAVEGVDTVLHLASASYQGSYTKRVELDGTRRLAAEARRAGVGHLIYLSIVGIEHVPMGYFKAKLGAEGLVRDAGVPFSILRMTQFHAFVEEMLVKMRRRIGLYAADGRWDAQPVDMSDAADRVVRAIADGPTGGTDNYGGPEHLTFRRLLDQYFEVRGGRRPMLPLRIPGRVGRGLRDGSLTTDAGPTGTITWREYLRSTAG